MPAPDPMATARQGFAGSAQQLPHLQQLQSSFGPEHDLSGVRAYVGGQAAQACDQLGASGYASEGAVAFKELPDLHLAAHEAAHVVQQQGQVQLANGVGSSGDVYERHADAVADAVVAGQSAAPLLAGIAGGGSLTPLVQRQDAPDTTGAGDAPVDPAATAPLEAEQVAARQAIIDRAEASSIASDAVDLDDAALATSGIGYLVIDPEPAGAEQHGDVYEISDFVKVLAQIETRNLIVVALPAASATAEVAYAYAPVKKQAIDGGMVIDASDSLAAEGLYHVERKDDDTTIVRGTGEIHGEAVSYVLAGPDADAFLELPEFLRAARHEQLLMDDFRTTTTYFQMLHNLDFAIDAYEETERGLPWPARAAIDLAQVPGDIYAAATAEGAIITVVDGADFGDDHVSWLAAAVRVGEVEMSSAKSMVDAVIADADGRKIQHLNILDHGNSNGFQLGDDWVNKDNLPRFEAVLSELTPHFAEGATVHLQHCDVGQNHPLLAELARIWGVSVYAATKKNNPIYRATYDPSEFEMGQYERCDPDGTCRSDVDLPYGKWGQ